MAGQEQSEPPAADAGAGLDQFLDSRPLAPGSGAQLGLPTRIGRYRVVRRLGEGGMGVVFEAQQEAPRRRVAIKVLKPALAGGRLARRVEGEAAALARLEHEGIARVYEAGWFAPGGELTSLGRLPFFAMEYVEGVGLTEFVRGGGAQVDSEAPGSLASEVHQVHGVHRVHSDHAGAARPSTDRSEQRQVAQGALPLRARVELMARTCDAVDHAHRKLVIHRDLKPGNILVTADGQPKVLDFGIAKLLDPDVQVSTIGTRPEEIVGTLPYMSPEQALGDPRAMDVRSDVYSLGAVLYELLAGRPPLELRSASLLDAVRVVREDDPPRLTSLDQSMPRSLDCVVAKALAKSPEKRYASAGELAADLRRFLAGDPVLAAPRRPWDGVRAYSRRHKAVVASAVAAALALSVGLGLATWQAIEARQAARVAQQRFEDVRALANTMIFDLHDAVAPLPGSTPVRRLIVDTGLEYLDALAASGAATPGVRREIAEGYIRIGDVLGNHAQANLGDLAAGGAAHKRAIPELEVLVRQSPQDVELRRMLARAHLGAKYTSGDPDGLHTKQALELLEAIWRQQPNDPVSIVELADGRREQGLKHVNDGRHEEGFARFEQGIAQLEQWPGLDESFDGRVVLAELKFWLGYHRWELDGTGAGLLREALAMQERLVDQRPDDVILQGRLTSIHATVARAAAIAGRRDEAARSIAESLRLAQWLYERDPENQRAHRQFSIAIAFAGEAHEALAEHAPGAETAREDLRRALEHHLRYRDMVAQRVARGWLHPWESHYPAEADDFVARCEGKLNELERALADGP